jgi:hypothetical protein
MSHPLLQAYGLCCTHELTVMMLYHGSSSRALQSYSHTSAQLGGPPLKRCTTESNTC